MDLLTHPEDSDTVRIKRMILSQAVALAMPGVPGIYFHSLVGSRNYHHGVEMTGINRSINRQKIFWHKLKESLDTQGSLESIIFHTIKKLLSIRIHEPAFNPFGSFSFPELHEAVFAIIQDAIDGTSRIVALHNLSDCEVFVTIPDFSKKGTNLLNHEEVSAPDITLSAYEIAWIKFETIPQSNKETHHD